MKAEVFYDILDKELAEIIQKYEGTDIFFRKHEPSRDNERKSYAFLIWFLDFYGQKPSYKNYITDGDDDSSCDIIFSNTDSQDKTVFYIVQSKWRAKKNLNKEFKTEEFKQTLNDFETILRGDKKKSANEKFNQKYDELIKHLENNGEAKFIYFTLDKHNPKANTNIASFQKQYAPNVNLEVIAIDRIKRDFIEFRYKQIKVNNPLEYHYNPEDSEIELEIERFGDKSERDFLEYDKPFRAYIFILRPKVIFELFEKFQFSLFFKNVRNPLPKSNFNQQMAETLKREPSSFWYFNNGITAITKIIPEVGLHAKKVKLTGLQIINGAQTVYTIYATYKEANATQREIMDEDVRITLRLIRSSNEDFNLQITRFTNSQNPMEDRDFKANDEIQQRLQEESFNTPIWYERRRGEFRDELVPEFIKITSNDNFIVPYATFYLQEPNLITHPISLFFKSRKEHTDGLYEKVFNENTKYEDFICSLYMQETLINLINPNLKPYLGIFSSILSISRVILSKYLKIKYSDKFENVNQFIKKGIEKSDIETQEIIQKIMIYSFNMSMDKLFFKNKKTSTLKKFYSSNFGYEKLKEEIEDIELKTEDIESIDIQQFIQSKSTNQ